MRGSSSSKGVSLGRACSDLCHQSLSESISLEVGKVASYPMKIQLNIKNFELLALLCAEPLWTLDARDSVHSTCTVLAIYISERVGAYAYRLNLSSC